MVFQKVFFKTEPSAGTMENFEGELSFKISKLCGPLFFMVLELVIGLGCLLYARILLLHFSFFIYAS